MTPEQSTSANPTDEQLFQDQERNEQALEVLVVNSGSVTDNAMDHEVEQEDEVEMEEGEEEGEEEQEELLNPNPTFIRSAAERNQGKLLQSILPFSSSSCNCLSDTFFFLASSHTKCNY